MPKRARRNKLPKRAVPLPSKPQMGSLVANYDGRANTNAGKFVQEAAMQDVQGDGEVVTWKK